MAAAGAAALMAGEPQIAAARIDRARRSCIPMAKADACILLWMAGGMAAPETFDPKRYQPFEVGLPVEKVMSTFPAIDTAVDNIKISQGLENIAERDGSGDADPLARAARLGHILHSRHQYHWHTGYVPPQTVAAPHIGAWMARVLGPINPVMPPFINIGQRLEGNGESEELKAFTTGGFFGSEFGPFNLPFPEDAIDGGAAAEGHGRGPVRESLSAVQEAGRASSPQSSICERLSAGVDAAVDRCGAPAAEFEGQAGVRSVARKEESGSTSRRQPLRPRLPAGAAAGRAGARFVEVTTEYIPFVHWDTHENGHATTEQMKQEIDRPIAQLILDLEDRGLLDRTLVVLASEFSRDMMIEGVPGSTAKDQSRAKTDVLEGADPLRPAPALHRFVVGADVRRRHEARVSCTARRRRSGRAW